MLKRLLDCHIWTNQTWFRKLEPLDKLAFLYIKDVCDCSGVWDVDCEKLQYDTSIENFNMHEFIKRVNVEYDKFTGNKTTKIRLRIIHKTKLWITGFMTFQYAGKDGILSPQAGAVIKAFEYMKGHGILEEAIKQKYIILSDKIAPKIYTPGGGSPTPSLEGVDPLLTPSPTPSTEGVGRVPQEFGEGPLKTGGGSPENPERVPTPSQEGVGRGSGGLNKNKNTLLIDSLEEKREGKEEEKKVVEFSPEIPPVKIPPVQAVKVPPEIPPAAEKRFALQDLYAKNYEQLNGAFEGLTKQGFLRWKKFVDFIREKHFEELFNTRFISPLDFESLNFPEDKWEPILVSILGSGVQPHHNLFFRIPKFLNYSKPVHAKRNSAVGEKIEFD